MEKVVKGATKIKLAAPKSKYVEAILGATNGGEAGVAEVFRTLQIRLRDSTWTIVFKSLIIVHLMIREGQSDITLRYIAESPKRLAISNFADVQTQGTNIRRYSDYLLEKARGYRDTKTDFVRGGTGRLKELSVDKGLLRETEAVQSQIRSLIKCDLLGSSEPDNEITLTAFRLLTMDLLELFKVMNEGTINVLEHYFEMSRPDAERALGIYKMFGRLTDQVVQYLSAARQYESLTRLEVPKLKHAPTTLTSSLEEYLNDPDFEINRRQYLVQQEAKKGGIGHSNATTSISKPPQSTPFDNMDKSSSSVTKQPAPTATSAAPPKAPAPDLIDFFDSIEHNPQTYSNGFQPQPQPQPQPSQYQQLNVVPQQSGYNPFLPQQVSFPQQQHPQHIQPDFTGAGFGGYTAQPQQPPQGSTYQPFQSSLASIPQSGVPSFQQPAVQVAHQQQPLSQLQPQQTSSNPFRQSMMATGSASNPAQFSNLATSPSMRQSTNPFKHDISSQEYQQQQQSGFGMSNTSSNSPFTSQPSQTQSQDLSQNSTMFSPPNQQQQPLQAQRTGTNPFARNKSPPLSNSASPLVANPTGSTNPFRQSTFVNQQTGMGWQHTPGGQGYLAGVDINNVDTVPVFPRPGAQ